jgi:hypothetical protein
MKVIIAGSRSITDYNILLDVMNKCEFTNKIDTVISGMALGVDILGARWAKENHKNLIEIPANWRVDGKFNRGAGYQRNLEMLKIADGLIVIIQDYSRGSQHVYNEAVKLNLPICLTRL